LSALCSVSALSLIEFSHYNLCVLLLMHDILDSIVQRVNDIPCLKRLFCVSKGFRISCKQRFAVMNREMESKLREEIRFLLKLEPGYQVSGYPQMLVKLSLSREYLLNSRQNVLDVAESTYELETQSKLDFRELKVKTRNKPKTGSKYVLNSSIASGGRQSRPNMFELIKRHVLQLCRSTTDDSRVIRSKVRAFVRTTRMILDSAILSIDDQTRRIFTLGQEVDRMYGQAVYEGLNSCVLRINAIMEDRVLIGAWTVTQVAFASDPEKQVKVQFVRNSAPFELPFTHTAVEAAAP
jgi:hypothetical protein